MGLKIVAFSNSPWSSSGYGIQGRYLLPRLQAKGHEIFNLAFWGLEGGIMRSNGMVCYPKGTDPYGNDVIQPVSIHSGADIVITLIDAWVLKEFPAKAPFGRWLPWMPIDHEPAPGPVVEAVKDAYYVLPYSKHGEEELRKAKVANRYGESNVLYMPLGVESRIYSPAVNEEQRRQAKIMLGFPPDSFVAGMVAANKGFPPRKCFDRQFEAFARFKAKHPDAFLYVHTDPTTVYGGMDLVAEAQAYDLPPGAIRFPDRFLNWLSFPDTWMAQAYRAFDVYLGATGAEGWGIPIVEAMSCGVRPIVTDFTAMRQHVEHLETGYKAKVAATWKTPLKSYQALPDIADIAEGLEWAYQQPRGPHGPCVEYARQYDWQLLVDNYWQPLLEEIEGRIAPYTRVERAPIQEIQSWLVDSFYPDYQQRGEAVAQKEVAAAP